MSSKKMISPTLFCNIKYDKTFCYICVSTPKRGEAEKIHKKNMRKRKKKIKIEFISAGKSIFNLEKHGAPSTR